MERQAARLLVHPSVGLGDGVPTVIKEAAALGTPVVGTRAVGIPELVADGETGLLVEPDNPVALAEVMVRLLTDPLLADRMAQAGRARAERMFDLYANTARLADRMRQIVSLSGEQQHGRG
jgi:glycosyltransferase involved in cell wall biosynthesis